MKSLILAIFIGLTLIREAGMSFVDSEPRDVYYQSSRHGGTIGLQGPGWRQRRDWKSNYLYGGFGNVGSGGVQAALFGAPRQGRRPGCD